MLNIVIPMAGAGSRFARAGYALPKPLIPVHGVPMIRLVIDNIRPARPHRFMFIAQRAHVEAHGLGEALAQWAPGSVLVPIDGLTEGAACTVLAARDWIAGDDPLMIANSDQYVDLAIDAYLADMDRRGLDGLIMTMRAHDPKWSFVRVDAEGLAREVAEKKPISDIATVGIYNFARGADFLRHADAMLAADERVNGEFYVAPVYNRMIAAGARIGVHDLGEEALAMHGLGIPEDLDRFLGLPISQRATLRASGGLAA